MKCSLFVVIFVLSFCLNSNNLTAAKPEGKDNKACLNDRYRPQIHYSVPSNWMNDPNGMVYHNGEYHLFYQYNPFGTTHGPMYWGHAVSRNLVHWEDLPTALSPDPLGDIFSGSAVVDSRNTSGLQTGSEAPIIAIFTHAGQTQQQSIAVSNNDGRDFEKYAGNPVLPAPNGVPDFRDPKVMEHNGKWVMSLAVGDKIEFYQSEDLKNWIRLSEFGANPSEGAHGGVWECPDLLDLEVNGETIWVLLVSINPGGPNAGSATQYFLGEFDGTTFRSYQTNEFLWMDWGPDNYAGVTFANEPQNRKVMMAWMNNWNYANELPTAVWRGQMTLPRVFQLRNVEGKVRLASVPAEEIAILRNPSQVYTTTNRTINPDSILSLPIPFQNPLLEVDLVFDFVGYPDISICFFNNQGQTVCFGYEHANSQFYLDRTNSGNTFFDPDFNGRLTASRDSRSNTVKVKIFMDVSSVEVFADDGLTCMTGLFFPDQPLVNAYISHVGGGAGSTLLLRSANVQGLNSIMDC